MAAEELSAAFFCGNDRTTFPQNPVKLKYAVGQTAELCFAGAGSRGSISIAGYTGMESPVKGVAFRDTLAGLKGGSPHLGAGAKRPARVEGKAPPS